MEKRWNISVADESTVTALQSSLKVNRNICKMLVQRGINDYEAAKNYFRPQLSQLHDPFF